jgi:hypothetical protein
VFAGAVTRKIGHLTPGELQSGAVPEHQKIDVKEFAVLVADAGLSWDNLDVKEMFGKLDRSGDGLVSLL